MSRDVRVEAGAHVVDSILFEGVTVGAGSRVSRCIIDKGVTIPPATVLDFDSMSDNETCVISEKGVIVIPKGYNDWACHSSQIGTQVVSAAAEYSM